MDRGKKGAVHSWAGLAQVAGSFLAPWSLARAFPADPGAGSCQTERNLSELRGSLAQGPSGQLVPAKAAARSRRAGHLLDTVPLPVASCSGAHLGSPCKGTGLRWQSLRLALSCKVQGDMEGGRRGTYLWQQKLGMKVLF